MEKIAVFVDNNGEIGTFTNSKYLRLYGKGEKWEVIKEIQVKSATSISKVRDIYLDLASKLDDCKVLIINEAVGIPYSVFYSLDYSVWELSGNPTDYLDSIIKREKEHYLEEKEKEKESLVELIKDKQYFIDLEKIQLTKPEVTSKKAIIPFMEKNDFDTLEVHCCHVPPWLEAKSNKGEIKMAINKKSNKDITLIISKVVK